MTDQMADEMFARLEPDLSETVERTYERRREADLALALRTPHEPPSRLSSARSTLMARRSRLLIAGGAVAGLAAAAVAVVPAIGSGSGHEPAPAIAAIPSGTSVDARSFLLTAAETATHERTRTGRYWYTETRTSSLVTTIPSDYKAKVGDLVAELRAKKKAAHGDAAALTAAERDFDAKLTRLKLHGDPPFTAATAETKEVWRAREPGGENRNVTHQDPDYTFGSPQDRAKWKAMGSPSLVFAGSRTSDDTLDRVVSIDNLGLTLKNVSALPTDAGALKSRLRKLYKERPAGRTDDTFALYLWQTGSDLLTAPTSSGTRAALFRVLAQQPGITARSQVTDVLGRRGVALTLTGPGDETARGDITYRLIIDPGTARLLQTDMRDARSLPLLTEAYKQTGWVDRLGHRPQD